MVDHEHNRTSCVLGVLPRWVRVLVLLTLMLFNVSWASESPVTDFGNRQGTLCESCRNVPQWQDVGLEDLLVVSSQPSVPTARTARQVYTLGEAFCRWTLIHTPKTIEQSEWVVVSRSVPGCWIYFLLRLRL